MKVDFKTSFLRDIKKVKDVEILNSIDTAIQNIENATSINEIKNIKKLTGFKTYYRIKAFDFRIGLNVENEVITFVRFLHRKDIYKFFP
jgi:mRNA interferase RelE/StbE